MSEEKEVKPKKRTGLIVFLTILIILLVAALAVFATLYFTGSDLLKFNKEDSKAEVAEEEKEGEKTNKKSSKTTEKDTKTDSKKETKNDNSMDLNSLITGGDKTSKDAKNTTTPNVSDLAGTTSNTGKVPVSSTVFTTILEKNGIKCEVNQGTTGVNELYIGYADDQKSSASYIKFDYDTDCTKYYEEQRDKMVSTYSTSGSIKKDSGSNWESMRITLTGSTSIIYMERVGNVLVAISTDDATMYKNMETIIKSLGY